MVGVVIGYWWWLSHGGGAGDSLFKGGRCNSCWGALMVVFCGGFHLSNFGLEDTARYAGFLLAPVEGFVRRPRLFFYCCCFSIF